MFDAPAPWLSFVVIVMPTGPTHRVLFAVCKTAHITLVVVIIVVIVVVIIVVIPPRPPQPRQLPHFPPPEPTRISPVP